MNNITIHGRITRDPELKTYTNRKNESGSMCNFTVAVNRSVGEDADFFNCTAFGKSGETISKWFHKGDGIVVSGEMQGNKKNDKTYWGIVVRNWDFAEKKDGASKPSNDVPNGFEELNEDVPF